MPILVYDFCDWLKAFTKKHQYCVEAGPSPCDYHRTRTADEFESVLRHMEKGAVQTAALKEAGVAYTSFRIWLDKNPDYAKRFSEIMESRLNLRGRATPMPKVAEIQRLLDDGWKQTRIATRLGCSQSMVSKVKLERMK